MIAETRPPFMRIELRFQLKLHYFHILIIVCKSREIEGMNNFVEVELL
jgi:hypothetical protein